MKDTVQFKNVDLFISFTWVLLLSRIRIRNKTYTAKQETDNGVTVYSECT